MASAASISSQSGDPGPDSGASTRAAPVAAGEAVAVAQHDDFLLELGEALGGQISLRPVETLEAALEHLASARRPRILLIDTRDAADLRADIERAHAQAAQVPIVVFAPAETEQTVAATLKTSNIFAVLSIPVDARKTAAILEGALAEATTKLSAGRVPDRPAERHASPQPPLTPEAQPARRAPARLDDSGESHDDDPPRRPFRLALFITVGIVAAAGVAWYVVRGYKHSSSPTAALHAASSNTPSAAPPVATRAVTASSASKPAAASGIANTAPVGGTVDSLLEKARRAMRERHFLPPAEDSALVDYLSVLKMDPKNGEARDGLTRLEGLATSRFHAAMTAGRFDAAAAALANLKLASPSDARLNALRTQLLRGEISQALATKHLDRAASLIRQARQSHAASASELAAWRAQLASGQNAARITHLAGLIETSIQAGHLSAPRGASALDYLHQLEALAPDTAAERNGAHELIGAYLSRARRSAVAGASSDAEKWVAAARAAGMSGAEYSAYERSLAKERSVAAAHEADRLQSLARARIQSGQLLAPAHDNANYYLSQLQGAHGEASVVHSIGLQLASSLIAQATAAARAGHVSAMRADLAAAHRWGADPVLIAAVRQIVRGQQGAAPTSTRRSAQIPAGYRPQRTRYVAPQYPESALEARESGVVTVEFTVDLDGKPRHVRVVKSKPRGVFDYAAVNAVSQWRFAPPVINNVPTEIPTRTVIRFVAPK